MFWAYIIKNDKGKTYIGSTADSQDRLRMHNSADPVKAKFHRTTYKRGPWEIMFSQEFASREEAMEFEKFLKTGKGRKWLERARLGG